MQLSPVFQLINADNTISVNRHLARALGLNAAVVYSALIAKYTYYADNDLLTDDGYFYSTIVDLEESTSLSRKQQDGAIAKLVDEELISTCVKGSPPKRYFTVSNDVANLDRILSTITSKSGGNQFVQKGQIDLSKRDKLNCPKGANQIVPKGQIDLTEKDKSILFYKSKDINLKINNQSINQGDDGLGDDEKGVTDKFREEYGYNHIVRELGVDKAESYLQIIYDVLHTKSHHLRIGGEDMSASRVKAVYRTLNPAHIHYVDDCISEHDEPIKNIKAYIRTALYNAPSTMDAYYFNKMMSE